MGLCMRTVLLLLQNPINWSLVSLGLENTGHRSEVGLWFSITASALPYAALCFRAYAVTKTGGFKYLEATLEGLVESLLSSYQTWPTTHQTCGALAAFFGANQSPHTAPVGLSGLQVTSLCGQAPCGSMGLCGIRVSGSRESGQSGFQSAALHWGTIFRL